MSAVCKFATFLVLVLCACARSDTAPSLVNVRDSAGISIFENTRSPLLLHVIDSTPVVIIGGREATARISGLAGASIQVDGTFLVADRVEQNVRLFDSTGQYIRTIVGHGNGPQELNAVTGLLRAGDDTLYAVDAGQRSVIVIAPDNRVVRKVSGIEFRSDSARGAASPLAIAGVLNDGSIVTSETSFTMLPEGATARDAMELLKQNKGQVFRRGTTGGQELAFYGELPPPLRERTDGRRVLQSPPVSLAAGDELYYSRGDTLVVMVYVAAGNLQRIMTVSRPRIEVPSGSMPAQTADGKPSTVNGMSPFMPDIVQFIRDDSGRLWTTSFEVAKDGTARPYWFVFSPNGTLAMEVHSQRPMGVLAVRGDLVLGGFADSNDEPRLMLFRLRRQ